MDYQKRLAQIANELRVLGFKEESKQLLQRIAEWENQENEPLPKPAPDWFASEFKNDPVAPEPKERSESIENESYNDEESVEDWRFRTLSQSRGNYYNYYIEEWLQNPTFSLSDEEHDRLASTHSKKYFMPILIERFASLTDNLDKELAFHQIEQTARVIIKFLREKGKLK